jgi:hypothetical protein
MSWNDRNFVSSDAAAAAAAPCAGSSARTSRPPADHPIAKAATRAVPTGRNPLIIVSPPGEETNALVWFFGGDYLERIVPVSRSEGSLQEE